MSKSYADDPALQRSLHRWEAAGAVVFLLLVVAFPLYRASEAAGRADTTATRQADLAASGRELWAQNCASCHGEDGEGMHAPALNSRQFLEDATPHRTDALVRAGIPGTNMQAWGEEFGGPLTEEQIRAISVFVWLWKDDAPDLEDWRTRFLGTPPLIPIAHDHGSDESESPTIAGAGDE